MRKPPRSLFKKPKGKSVEATKENLQAFFRNFPSESEQLSQHLQVMERAAQEEEDDPQAERGIEFVTDMRLRIMMLKDAVAAGDAARAANQAMKITEAWMMLRADVVFAPHVRAREQYLDRRDDGQRERAEQILRRTGSVTTTAQEMGISDRAVRKLIPSAVRKSLIRRR